MIQESLFGAATPKRMTAQEARRNIEKINAHVAAMARAGHALIRIRDSRSYRVDGYSNFESWYSDELGLTSDEVADCIRFAREGRQ